MLPARVSGQAKDANDAPDSILTPSARVTAGESLRLAYRSGFQHLVYY